MSLIQSLQSRISHCRMDLQKAHKEYEDNPCPENAGLIRQAKGALVQADAALGAACRFPPLSLLN